MRLSASGRGLPLLPAPDVRPLETGAELRPHSSTHRTYTDARARSRTGILAEGDCAFKTKTNSQYQPRCQCASDEFTRYGFV